MTRPKGTTARPSSQTGGFLLVVAFAALVLIALLLVSPYALVALLVDGLPALLMMTAVCGGGFALLPRLGFGEEPTRWQIVIGSALGIGLFSILVLLSGLAGLHSRTGLIALLAVSAGAGLLRARTLRTNVEVGDEVSSEREGPATSRNPALHMLWLLLVPTLVCALLAAATAPGLIWKEEGFGYDILEYHLQVPREYYDASVIRYLPHNVYAAFPSAVEMLYLAGMKLMDDPVAGGSIANYIHLSFGALCVFTVWAFARDFGPGVGVLTAIAFGSTGWLVYLSGLAYVENGLLFLGLAATGLLLRTTRSSVGDADDRDKPEPKGTSSDTATPNRGTRLRPLAAMAVAGTIAGFCASCKYTGLPMLVVPLSLMALVLTRGSVAERAKTAGVLLAAALLTLSPWLVRNLVQTGNPVFPLANQVFDARPPGFGDDQARQWNVGHSARANVEGAEDGVSAAARVRRVWSAVLADPDLRFSPAILLLALIGAALSKVRCAKVALLLLAAAQLAVWLTLTHLYARFAVVLLIPAGLLAARGVQALLDRERFTRWRYAQAAAIAIVILGCTGSTIASVRMVMRERAIGAPAALLTSGSVPGYEFLGFINESLPEDAHILLVGEARPFYMLRNTTYAVVFNRSPFADLLESGASDGEVIDWLRENGITHVLVNWREVLRLRGSYGFSSAVTPDRFEALQRSGLTLIHQQRVDDGGPRYVDIYAVPAR